MLSLLSAPTGDYATACQALTPFFLCSVVSPVWAQPTKPAEAAFDRLLAAVNVHLTAMGGNGAAIGTGVRVLGATSLAEGLERRIKASLLDAQKVWNRTPYSALGVHAANFHVNGESSSRRTTAAYYTGNSALSGLPAHSTLKTPLGLASLPGHAPSPVPLLSVASLRTEGGSSSSATGSSGAGAMPSSPPARLDWASVATLVKAKTGIGASATVGGQQQQGSSSSTSMDMDYSSEYSSSCSSGALHCADCGCDIPLSHGQGSWGGAPGAAAPLTTTASVWPHAHPPQHWSPVDTLQARAKGSRVSVEVVGGGSMQLSLGMGLGLGMGMSMGAGSGMMMEDGQADGSSRGRSDTGRSVSSLAVGMGMSSGGLPGPSPAGLAQLSAWQAAGLRSVSTLPVSAFTVSCPTPPPALPAQSPTPSLPGSSATTFAMPVATHPAYVAYSAWAAVGAAQQQQGGGGAAGRAAWVPGGEEQEGSQGSMDEDL